MPGNWLNRADHHAALSVGGAGGTALIAAASMPVGTVPGQAEWDVEAVPQRQKALHCRPGVVAG